MARRSSTFRFSSIGQRLHTTVKGHVISFVPHFMFAPRSLQKRKKSPERWLVFTPLDRWSLASDLGWLGVVSSVPPCHMSYLSMERFFVDFSRLCISNTSELRYFTTATVTTGLCLLCRPLQAATPTVSGCLLTPYTISLKFLTFLFLHTFRTMQDHFLCLGRTLKSRCSSKHSIEKIKMWSKTENAVTSACAHSRLSTLYSFVESWYEGVWPGHNFSL